MIAKILTAIDRLGGEIAFDEAYLFGSVTKPFRFLESSDIDIGFVGLDNGHFFKAMSYLSEETGHDVDIVQIEDHGLADKIKRGGIRWRRRDSAIRNAEQDPVTAQDFLHKLRMGVRTLQCVAKHHILWWLLGAEDRRALEIGRFRLVGEVHQWMYDRYSLARLLGLTGFRDPQLQDANTSRIPNWTSFHLDTLPDGQVIKPDLFFMEAIKPGEPIHD